MRGLGIPEGKVIKIEAGGMVLWEQYTEPDEPIEPFNYVSFGDSISAGHFINDAWYDPPYNGGESQYGVNGNTETLIVENCYVDLIHRKLQNVYGEGNVKTTSFSRSGARIKSPYGGSKSLIDTLDDQIVIDTLAEADLVTVCIGANDILEAAATKYYMPYLTQGIDLAPLEAEVEANMRILADDNNDNSYNALFNKINDLIKKDAKVVFTTIYNPMKYLWIEKGTWDNDYKDGFFGTFLDTIPDLSLFGNPDLLDIDKEIKKGLLNTPAFTRIIERINVLGEWAEKYLDKEGKSKYYLTGNENNGIPEVGEYPLGEEPAWLGLSPIIRKKVTEYQKVNPNFYVTDAKKLFDSVPDRLGEGELHYNDLVHVDITKGIDANDLPWENLWGDSEGETVAEKITKYWLGLVGRHWTLKGGLDINGMAEELMPAVIDKIILPTTDSHPRADGHYAMYRAFADTLGFEPLKTITYNANGGTGSMAEQKVLDASVVNGVSKKVHSILKPNAFSPPTGYVELYRWQDGNGYMYLNEQAVPVTEDTELNAVWGYEVTVNLTNKSWAHGNDVYPLPNQLFGFTLDGSDNWMRLDRFTDSPRKYIVPNGAKIKVWVGSKYGRSDSFIQVNGTNIGAAKENAYYAFNVTSNTSINFEWVTVGVDGIYARSYWRCYITK